MGPRKPVRNRSAGLLLVNRHPDSRVQEWSDSVTDKHSAQGSVDEAKQKAGEAADKAKQQTGEAADKAKQKAGEVTQEAKNRAGEVKDKIMAQAQEAKTRVQAEAEKGFEQGKSRVVSQVSSVAQAFRKTSEQLREEDQGDLAGYTERIAEQVEKMSGYLEGKGLRGAMDDLETLARQRPGLFVGGALVVGLVAARFLRSSSPDGSGDAAQDPYR